MRTDKKMAKEEGEKEEESDTIEKNEERVER